jgi:hypothetical protein
MKKFTINDYFKLMYELDNDLTWLNLTEREEYILSNRLTRVINHLKARGF